MKDTSAASRTPPTGDGYAAKLPVGNIAKGQKPPNFGERHRLFYLAAHPTSWELAETSEGWRIIPTLKRLIIQAGVNWTKPTGKGAPPDPALLWAKAQTKLGFTVLTDTDAYMYATPGAAGKVGHFLNWENVRTYEDGLYEVDFDADGYDLWRWSLVVDKAVAHPRESVISQMRTRLKRQRERATRTPHLAQAQEAKAEAERRTKGLEEALSVLRPKAAAKDKPAKGNAAPKGKASTSPPADDEGGEA